MSCLDCVPEPADRVSRKIVIVNSENNRAVWIDMPVSDLDRAVDFYSAVLAIS